MKRTSSGYQGVINPYRSDKKITGDVTRLTEKETKQPFSIPKSRLTFKTKRPEQQRNEYGLPRSEITAPRTIKPLDIKSQSLADVMVHKDSALDFFKKIHIGNPFLLSDYSFGEKKGQSKQNFLDLEDEGKRRQVFLEMNERDESGETAASKYIKNSIESLKQYGYDPTKAPTPQQLKHTPELEAYHTFMTDPEAGVEQLIETSLKDRKLGAAGIGAMKSALEIVPAATGLAELAARGVGADETAERLGKARMNQVEHLNKPYEEMTNEERRVAGYGETAETLAEWITLARSLRAGQIFKGKKIVPKGHVGGLTREADLRKLGLSKNATKKEIKTAFRNKAKTLHPDKGGSAKDFAEVNSSYERLSGKNPNAASYYSRMDKELAAAGEDLSKMDDLARAQARGKKLDAAQEAFIRETGEIGTIESYLNMKAEFMKEDPSFDSFLRNTIEGTAEMMAFIKVLEGGYAAFKSASPEVKAQFKKAQAEWKKWKVEYDPNTMGTFGGNMKFTRQAPKTGKAMDPMESAMRQTPETSLHREALKYENARDFAKSQIMAFHTTDKNTVIRKWDTKKSQGRIWFTDNKKALDNVGASGKGKVYEVAFDPDAKWATEDQAEKSFTDQLISEGYDGVLHKDPSGEYGNYYEVFNPKVIKTNSQLKKIYKEAHEEKTVSKEHEEALKYDNVEDFLDSQEIVKVELSGSMDHRPSFDDMPPAYDLLKGGTLPRDVYTHPDYSIGNGAIRRGEVAANESWDALQKIKGNPGAKITVYRAAPINELRNGDWITLSEAYAKQESLDEGTPVNSFEVDAKDVIFAGDDINEFGYWGHGTKEKQELERIYEEAHSGKTPIDSKNKYLSGGKEMTPGDINQKASELSLADVALGGAELLDYVDSTMHDLNKNEWMKYKEPNPWMQNRETREDWMNYKGEFSGENIAKELSEQGTDGGWSEYALDQIKKENYKIKNIDLNELLKSDPDFAEYYKSGEDRDVSENATVLPVVSSKGEVLDGYSRLSTIMKNGYEETDVLFGQSIKNKHDASDDKDIIKNEEKELGGSAKELQKNRKEGGQSKMAESDEQKSTVKPKRTSDDIAYEQEIFKYISEGMKSLGKKISTRKVEGLYQELLASKNIEGIDDFLKRSEVKLAEEKKAIEDDIKKSVALESKKFEPLVEEEIDKLVEDPRVLAKMAGFETTQYKKAAEYLLERDISSPGIESKFDDIQNFGSTEDVILDDMWDYYKDRIEEKYFKGKEVKKNPRVVITERQLLKKQISSFNKGFKIGSTTTKKDLDIIKKEINTYARKNIPNFETKKSELTKIMTKIAKAKSPDDIKKAFESIDEIVVSATKRLLVRKYNKLLKAGKTKKVNGRLTGKLTPETQRVVDNIKTYKDMSLEEINEKINTNAESLLNFDGTLEEELALRLESEALFYAGFSEMPVHQMLERYELLKEVLSGARNDKKIVMESEVRKAKSVAEMEIPVISGSNTGRTRLAKEDGSGNKTLRFLSDSRAAIFESWISTADLISKYDKTSGVDDSLFSQTADMAREADVEKKRVVKIMQNRLSDSTVTAFGTTKTKDLKKEMKEIKKQKVFAKGADQNGKFVNVTMNQLDAVDMVMQWRDPNSRMNASIGESFIESNGRRYELTEDLMEQVIENTDARLIKQMEIVQEKILSPLYKKQAPLMEESTGVPAVKNENYWMRSSETSAVQSYEAGVRERLRSSLGVPSSAKMRTKRVETIKYGNPYKKILKHIDDSVHYVSHYNFTKLYSRLFANKEWTNAIRDNHSQGILDLFQQQFQDIAAGKIAPSQNSWLRALETPVDAVMNRVVVAQLGLKPLLYVKQLTSIPAMVKNPITMPVDIADFFTNPGKHYRTLIENSQWLKNRHEGSGFEQDLDQLSAKDMVRTLLQKDSASDKGMKFIKKGDEHAIVIGGWHVYKEMLRVLKKKYPNMTETEMKKRAIKAFEKAASSTQQESALYARNGIQKVKILRPLRTYMTTAYQYAQSEAKYVRALMYGRGTYDVSADVVSEHEKILESTKNRKEIVTEEQFEETQYKTASQKTKKKSKADIAKLMIQYAAKAVLYHSALNMIFQFVGDGFEFHKKQQLRALVLGNIGIVPILGQAANNLWGRLFWGENFGEGDPFLSAATDAKELVALTIKLAGKVSEGEEITEKEVEREVKKLGATGGILSKLPLSGAITFGLGAYDLASDKTDDFRRLLYSKWSLGDPVYAIKDMLEEGAEIEELRETYDEAVRYGEVTQEFEPYMRKKIKDMWEIPSTDGKKLSSLDEETKDDIRAALTDLRKDRGKEFVDLFISGYKPGKTPDAYRELSQTPLFRKKERFWIPRIEKKKTLNSERKKKYDDLSDAKKIELIKVLHEKGLEKDQIRERLGIE